MLPSDIIRKVRKIDIITSRKVSESLAGGYHSVFKGRGVEFAEVRPYQPGDDVRFIDWNVTARTGELFSKRFTEERELVVNLLVDVSASQHFGSGELKQQYVAEVAALLAYSAIANGDRVGLILFSDRVEKVIPARKGKRHVLRLVRELLGYKPQGVGTDLAGALETLNRLHKRRSVTFVISDFLGDLSAVYRPARVAVRRHDFIPVVVRDRLEAVLPPKGLVQLVDAETKRRIWIDAGNARSRKLFAEAVTRESQALARMFADLHVAPIFLTNGEDAVRPIVRFFHLRQARR